MTIIKKLFGKRPAEYASANTVNHEGFPGWHRSLKEQYVQMLLTNTLSHTFYASQGENYALAMETHKEMFATDVTFAAKAIVYAREKGTMRTQPIIGLVALSLADINLFRQIFDRVILTPGDLVDFVQIVRSKQIRQGLGRSIKETVGAWMNRLSEYHAIKYGANSAGKMTLRDVLRLTHPQPIDERTTALFSYIVDRDAWREKFAGASIELLPQITALEMLKRTDNSVEQRALIAQGRLPYEIVTGVIKPDLDLWQELMQQMPYFALLRHLVTLQRAGVLANPEIAQYVAERLENREAMVKAKILPFRLHAAWVMFTPQNEAEQGIQAALERALEAAFVNLPAIDGRVVIAPDTSGSMWGSINAPSKVRYIDIAGIFSGALLKTNPNATMLPFDTQVHKTSLHSGQTLMHITSEIAKIGGGGTAVSAPISYLLKHKEAIDVFIGITDNVEWAADQYGGVGFLPTWRKYRETVAPDAQAFLVTITPYQSAMAPQDEPGINYIYGWADHVPAYIAQTLAGYANQVAAVETSTL